MSDATARFALPPIAPGQAQKELLHNEALARVDALVQPSVVAVAVSDPPVAPTAGQCWIVGDTPLGAWAGQPRSLAVWTDGGWRMIAAGRDGHMVDGEWRVRALRWRGLDARRYRRAPAAGRRRTRCRLATAADFRVLGRHDHRRRGASRAGCDSGRPARAGPDRSLNICGGAKPMSDKWVERSPADEDHQLTDQVWLIGNRG